MLWCKSGMYTCMHGKVYVTLNHQSGSTGPLLMSVSPPLCYSPTDAKFSSLTASPYNLLTIMYLLSLADFPRIHVFKGKSSTLFF